MFWKLFMYAPLGVFALTCLTFVCRLECGRAARLAWTLWLLIGFSKFCCFKWFGGHAFNPDFPTVLLLFWDWWYSGCVFLALLSVVFFFRFRHKALLLALAAWGLSAWGLWSGVRVPRVHAFDLSYRDLPPALDGYRIIQITDLHCSRGAPRGRTEAVVARANRLKADLICLTGDYVDGYVHACAKDLAPLMRLQAKDGVFAVTGNHEYYWRYSDWKTNFYAKATPIRFLTNACATPRPGLAVGGVPDPAGTKRREGQAAPDDERPDVARAFAQAPKGAFRILLEHQPKSAAANVARHGVRLQLSGHTHGGITPPFRPIIAAHNGGFVCGAYALGDAYLYVSPGSGQWEGFPMRFFNDSEISLITLRRANGGEK